jgi:putative transposase
MHSGFSGYVLPEIPSVLPVVPCSRLQNCQSGIQHKTDFGGMTDISLIDDKSWQVAKHRAEVIRPLAAKARCPLALVRAAAAELNLSERQVFTLMKRYRDSEGTTASLVRGASDGGKGVPRIGQEREALLHSIINDVYLTPQRLTPEAVIRETRRQYQLAGIKPPGKNTIRRRLKALTPDERGKRGESPTHGKVVSGTTPAARHPLDTIQMDHTKVDVILVDPIHRKPIGRPWITIAIDIFSRCIAGMHLSLEAPSATSVGLCLVHMASDKSQWLADRGVTAEWPIQGKPRKISVDNGAEFHSAAFKRGCEQHGIAIHWRPPGQPQFGGIVERVIGSLMKLVHELPGTTFSNPVERGGYDSDRMACLTLEELEHWMAVAITGVYHQRAHAGLDGESPLRRYQAGMKAMASAGELPPVIKNPRAFLIDFLPVLRRTVQRNGITVDCISYFCSALKPLIARRDPMEPVLVRRDPRDISRIYVFDRDTSGYLEVPYRDLSRPSITLWEHRLALRRLRDQHRGQIDEGSLFRAVTELRTIEKNAVVSTRTARRNQTRRMRQEPILPTAKAQNDAVDAPGGHQTLPPFSEIEEW